MAAIMKVDDEVRLNILSALLKNGSVMPNIRQIQRHTGYHKATVKSSLDFLAKEGLITGYGPKVNFKKFGYKLEVLTLMQADLAQKDFLNAYLAEVEQDANLYSLSGLVGSGNYNLVARHIYSDMESYNEGVNKKYFQKLQGVHDFIKRREIFYITEPFYKMSSRTGSLVKIIRAARGYGP